MGSIDSVRESPVYGIKLSSVVPATVTGNDRDRELSSMDLFMKLHYLRGLYFFSKDAVEGLMISDFKEPMFKWLNLWTAASGRIRKSELGRPFIKCNDGGVRIIEAQTNFTLDQWLRNNDWSLHCLLVSNQVLGPDLAFSPLVVLQFTWFKCGGMSLGLSWAHVLGHAFSASRFINMWGHILSGHPPPKSLNMLEEPEPEPEPGAPPTSEKSITSQLLSAKRIEPVGDHWLSVKNCKMEAYTFQITASQLTQLQSKISSEPFEALSVVIWQCLARIRENNEPRTVTICRKDSHYRETSNLISLSNNQMLLSVVKADISVGEANPSDLAALIVKGSVEEESLIEETVEGDRGLSDYIVYGTNLTFVDLEEVEIYGLEIRGHKPVFANYAIDGIGEEGVVLVLPGPENDGERGRGGRTVTISLPEDQLLKLKGELSKELFIA
ncbi:protein ECERIFERUM 2 [Macadamia integrifolia]|uniref:protein ECERIFERUM 2 n=1 Tax=Macadamia integrifolia TaxID=60698 RepID=UPI001C500957|nr:protein ECERIFERUM 2 [Macadamia integrifolia]